MTGPLGATGFDDGSDLSEKAFDILTGGFDKQFAVVFERVR